MRLNEIQDAIDQLRAVEMDDNDVEDMKTEFLQYVQDTWVDGTYPPHTWNCHGRNNENTNNVLERYNGILNRLIQVQHHNAYVLVSHFITEICAANETIERCLEGKVPVAKRSIYVKLGEERKELQKRYLKGLISRMDFLLRMGFKLIKLNQEYRRKRPEEQFKDPSSDDDIERDENSEDGTVHSFEDSDNPYEGRVVGVRANVAQPNTGDRRTKNKKCPVFDKRFINGKIRKSKVTECIACDRLTHERCAKSKHTVFKCVVCRSMEEEDESLEDEEELSEDDQANDEDDYVHEDDDTEDDVTEGQNSDFDLSETEFVTGIPAASRIPATSSVKENVETDSVLCNTDEAMDNTSEEEFTESMRIPESFEEEEDWERQDKLMKQQELQMKDKCRKNRNKIIDTLTDENIKHLVEENNDYLEAIFHAHMHTLVRVLYNCHGGLDVLLFKLTVTNSHQ